MEHFFFLHNEIKCNNQCSSFCMLKMQFCRYFTLTLFVFVYLYFLDFILYVIIVSGPTLENDERRGGARSLGRPLPLAHRPIRREPRPPPPARHSEPPTCAAHGARVGGRPAVSPGRDFTSRRAHLLVGGGECTVWAD